MRPSHNPTLGISSIRSRQAHSLVAYGDMRFTDPAVTSGTNPRVRKWLADRIATNIQRRFCLPEICRLQVQTTGDWQGFQTETARWREEQILQLPATGNHEIRGDTNVGIANYLANFPAIANHRYYSAILGSVEVISLDCTLPTAASSPQGKWFAAQLNNVPKQVEFLFILYHIPWVADRQSQILWAFPDPESLDIARYPRSHLPRIRAKVVVFNGHIHNYERFERQWRRVCHHSEAGARNPIRCCFGATPIFTRTLDFRFTTT